MTTIYIVTGEPSGDLLGARLMHAIRKLRPDIKFKGVGGERMIGEGLDPLYPQSDLAVFGLWEILPKIRLIFKRLKQTVASIKEEKPAVVVTIDSPDFNFRIGKRLKGSGVPIIHYVAPSVWAWRPGRAKKIAGFLTHILTLFRFEPPYFTKEGLGADFVGHPIIENGIENSEAAAFRREFNVPDNAIILTMLPGSRSSEIKHLLSVFEKVAERIKAKIPNLVVAMPTMLSVEATVRKAVGEWKVPVYVFLGDQQKYNAFAASRAALAASGTVNLEVALAKLPMVIAYKISFMTMILYYWLIRISLFSPVNILLKREAVPEAIQYKCTPEYISKKLLPLIEDENARQMQIAAFNEIKPMLQEGTELPSERAARVVLSYLPHVGSC